MGLYGVYRYHKRGDLGLVAVIHVAAQPSARRDAAIGSRIEAKPGHNRLQRTALCAAAEPGR